MSTFIKDIHLVVSLLFLVLSSHGSFYWFNLSEGAKTIATDDEDVPIANLALGGTPKAKDDSGYGISATPSSSIPHTATATPSEVPPPEEASKVDACSGNEGAILSPAKEENQNAPDSGADKENASGSDAAKIDAFTALDIASDIAKEVVEQVTGEAVGDVSGPRSDDKPVEMQEVEKVEGSDKETELMNAKPAEEIESPARFPGLEPPPYRFGRGWL